MVPTHFLFSSRPSGLHLLASRVSLAPWDVISYPCLGTLHYLQVSRALSLVCASYLITCSSFWFHLGPPDTGPVILARAQVPGWEQNLPSILLQVSARIQPLHIFSTDLFARVLCPSCLAAFAFAFPEDVDTFLPVLCPRPSYVYFR